MTLYSLMNYQRGDVILCRVPMPSTNLQDFRVRPTVVVSANLLNRILDDIMVVPCTSNTNRPLTQTQYLIEGDEVTSVGVRVKSVVRCESIFTVNQSMIIKKLGVFRNATINQINTCLSIALDLSISSA
jgi:mRNA interferase MazF